LCRASARGCAALFFSHTPLSLANTPTKKTKKINLVLPPQKKTPQAQDSQFIAANSPPPTQDIATHGDQYGTAAAYPAVKGAAAV
jgi:hypothetical protein